MTQAAISDPPNVSKPKFIDKAFVYKTFIVVFLGWTFVGFSNTFNLALSGMMEEMNYSSTSIGLVVSVYSFGGFISALWLPLLADRKGRRLGMCLSIAFATIFNSMIGFTTSIIQLLPLRFISAHGQTCQWGIGSSHLSEVVPARDRGAFLGLMQMGTPVGYFLCSAMFTVMMTMGFSWRTFSQMGIIGIVICIPVIFWLRESDLWLRDHGKKVPNTGGAAEVPPVTREKKITTWELFRPQYRKSTFVGMALHSIGAFWAWGNTTWFLVCAAQDFGMDAVARGKLNMLMWGVAIIGYPLAGKIGDMIGRRRGMLLFTVIILIGTLMMFVSSRSATPDVTLLYIATPIIGIGLGVHSILIAYSSEIFPSHVRATGNSLSIGVGRLSAVFSMMALGVIADVTTPTTAELVCAIGGFLMVPIVYIWGVETARKELTEIAD
ncbi:MFS family permease [Rhodobium orientis]|uniref:Major facilitator superfamily (MFS) profile domain-containing protein n=1 Tax=Rhodobium orientis TaxID=34017 RepID=A0A327JHT1_9HYPH|nr:MFS transporter [Rhodobium orientis]MBB4301893.1 MFS family permease [Rhodobium orientis]MBK5950131.1 hypothetical protein [Rhodobium orientis]RAI25685.1 hypothetical protein CH339_17155 [Rhodobium orientis]